MSKVVLFWHKSHFYLSSLLMDLLNLFFYQRCALFQKKSKRISRVRYILFFGAALFLYANFKWYNLLSDSVVTLDCTLIWKYFSLKTQSNFPGSNQQDSNQQGSNEKLSFLDYLWRTGYGCLGSTLLANYFDQILFTTNSRSRL